MCERQGGYPEGARHRCATPETNHSVAEPSGSRRSASGGGRNRAASEGTRRLFRFISTDFSSAGNLSMQTGSAQRGPPSEARPRDQRLARRQPSGDAVKRMTLSNLWPSSHLSFLPVPFFSGVLHVGWPHCPSLNSRRAPSFWFNYGRPNQRPRAGYRGDHPEP